MNNLPLRVMVVDDEAPAREELVHTLYQLPEVADVAEAADADECIEQLDRERFDALFLDVRMPRLDGLTLARTVNRLAEPPAVVFVTAYDEYAAEAFGVDAVDYLLKPVRVERLAATFQRLASRWRTKAAWQQAIAVADRIPVLSGSEVLLLNVDEVRVIAVRSDETLAYTPRGEHQVRLALHELEARLEKHDFLRVHRQFLVNLAHVVSIGSFVNGTYILRFAGIDLIVPVSRRRAAALRRAMHLRDPL